MFGEKRLKYLISSINDDAKLDKALGLCVEITEKELPFLTLALNFPHDRILFGDFPYSTLWSLINELKRLGATSLLDMGSGYGRLCLLASLTGFRKVWGIEIVDKRCREARRAAAALGLQYCRFICSDVARARWPRADAYVLMNSLYETPLRKVLTRLNNFAYPGELIGSISLSNNALDRMPWTTLVYRAEPTDPLSLSIYQICDLS